MTVDQGRGYAAHVRLYLAPYLGNYLLAELTAGQVQAMLTAIARHHAAAPAACQPTPPGTPRAAPAAPAGRGDHRAVGPAAVFGPARSGGGVPTPLPPTGGGRYLRELPQADP